MHGTPSRRLMLGVGAARAADRVDLIDEDGGRRVVTRHLEEDVHQLLRLSAPLGGERRQGAVEERRAAFLRTKRANADGKRAGCVRSEHARSGLTVATAFANKVLPVPGGPNISTPRQGRRMPWK